MSLIIPLAKGAVSLAGSLIKTGRDALAGKQVLVPDEVLEQRQAICEACDKRNGVICTICKCPVQGTLSLKLKFAHECCPHVPPKWDRWSPPEKPADTSIQNVA